MRSPLVRKFVELMLFQIINTNEHEMELEFVSGFWVFGFLFLLGGIATKIKAQVTGNFFFFFFHLKHCFDIYQYPFVG